MQVRSNASEISKLLSNLGSLVTSDLQATEREVTSALKRLQELEQAGARGILTQNQAISVRDAVPHLVRALNLIKIAAADQQVPLLEGPKIVPIKSA